MEWFHHLVVIIRHLIRIRKEKEKKKRKEDLQLQDENGFAGGIEDLFQSDDVGTGPAEVERGGFVQRFARQTGAATPFADHFGRESLARRRLPTSFNRRKLPPDPFKGQIKTISFNYLFIFFFYLFIFF